MSETRRGVSPGTIDGLLAETTPYLSCDECFDRLDVYVERRVADPHFEEPAMKVHLAACGACAEEAETLRELLEQDAG